MVFQQVSYDPDDCGDVLPDDLRDSGVGCIESYDNFDVGGWQRLGRQTTINGQIEPTIAMRPGEVQRWRMIHVGVRESLNLALIPEDENGRLHPSVPQTTAGRVDVAALRENGVRFVPLRVLAEDGIAYRRRDEHNSFTLEPGYRADALVTIDEPGTYRLVDFPSGLVAALLPQAEELSTLGRVVVSGEPVDMPLPPSRRSRRTRTSRTRRSPVARRSCSTPATRPTRSTARPTATTRRPARCRSARRRSGGCRR